MSYIEEGSCLVAEKLIAHLQTNHGNIKVELLPNQAPKTVRNFVELAEGSREWTHPGTGEKSTEPLYDGTIFHRVIPGFMIQGGDPLGQGIGGPGYEFDDEFYPDLYFDQPYLLAMANAGPAPTARSSSSPCAHAALNRKHTIFGEVTDGPADVVDAIAKTKTGRNDRPVEDVVLESVTIERVQA